MDKISNEGIIQAHPSIEGDNAYDWPTSTNLDEEAPKITYAAMDEHWGWVVAAGTYEIDFNI